MRDLQARLQLIWTIVQKDMRRARTPIIATAVIGIALGLLVAPLPLSMARFGPPSFSWSDLTLRAFYAISSIITALTLGLTFYAVHSGEVHKGTIRSIILYPVDANDIAIAKIASALLMTLLLSTILFFGPLGAFFLLGVLPFGDFVALHLMTLGSALVCLVTGVFLAHAIAHVAKRMIFTPAMLGSLFLLASILLTELAAQTIAQQVLELLARSAGRPPDFNDFLAAQAFARSVSALSPHHWGARLLSLAFGIFRGGGELPMAIPASVTVLATVAGYTWGRKLYLDVFIH